MKKYKDITGQRFGKLTAIKYDRTEKVVNGGYLNSYFAYKVYWLYKCECGVELVKYSSNVSGGQGQACSDCLSIERKNNLKVWSRERWQAFYKKKGMASEV